MENNRSYRNLITKFDSDDPLDSSEYAYFVISKNMKRVVNVALHKTKKLCLQFNMDGFPIFELSHMEFWPILGKIFSSKNIEYKPFIISIHSGIEKPK